EVARLQRLDLESDGLGREAGESEGRGVASGRERRVDAAEALGREVVAARPVADPIPVLQLLAQDLLRRDLDALFVADQEVRAEEAPASIARRRVQPSRRDGDP